MSLSNETSTDKKEVITSKKRESGNKITTKRFLIGMLIKKLTKKIAHSYPYFYRSCKKPVLSAYLESLQPTIQHFSTNLSYFCTQACV